MPLRLDLQIARLAECDPAHNFTGAPSRNAVEWISPPLRCYRSCCGFAPSCSTSCVLPMPISASRGGCCSDGQPPAFRTIQRQCTTLCLLRDRSRAPGVSAEAARPAEQANGPGLHHQRRSPHDLEEIAVSGQAGSRWITDFEACRNRSRALMGGC